jgi:1,4-alpha-glucan branching enzyme
MWEDGAMRKEIQKMIKKAADKNDKVKVTFTLPYVEGQSAMSVVGDFNDWQPGVTKLVKRNNGTCSVSVVLDPDQRYRFRYFAEDGAWVNDEAADAYEASEHGSENCIVLT